MVNKTEKKWYPSFKKITKKEYEEKIKQYDEWIEKAEREPDNTHSDRRSLIDRKERYIDQHRYLFYFNQKEIEDELFELYWENVQGFVNFIDECAYDSYQKELVVKAIEIYHKTQMFLILQGVGQDGSNFEFADYILDKHREGYTILKTPELDRLRNRADFCLYRMLATEYVR